MDYMSTSENKLCQGAGNISSDRYTISTITSTMTIPEDMFYSSTNHKTNIRKQYLPNLLSPSNCKPM
jgi:hypothetical protein